MLVVFCPNCGKEVAWVLGNKYRPFCSERCHLVDLGEWLNEENQVLESDIQSADDYDMVVSEDIF
ncbi:DNA gyrase inhibitor YacG [Glaesserella parasuis]|uniref:DNA gyrase inhibitor YacG n=1 Tax=Glaesserella parasuis TaxID=738 RepID=UPI003CE6CDB2